MTFNDSSFSPEVKNLLLKKGFKIEERINFGSFSEVYKARQNGNKIAAKVIDLSKTSKEYRTKFLPRELYTLQKLRHPNIINIHNIINLENKIFIFMDLAEGGDILDYLKFNGPIPENQAKIWFKQSTQALEYIHSFGIAHRDLKSENILLDKSQNAKLTDFGFSRTCYDSQTGKKLLSETYCGSAAYVAPEILQGIPYNPMLSDVWSLGIVLYVMVNNSLPFDDSDLSKMIQKQITKSWRFSSKVINLLSKEVKNLISEMLEPVAIKRPTLKQVLQHLFIQL